MTYNSRLLGCSFLFPHVIPEPHVTSVNLHDDDQVIIIANHGLWKYVSYQEAVDEVIDIPDPVLAAKKLQDLAQGYGSKESIGVLVVKLLLSDKERNRMKDILQIQFEAEQNLMSQLKSRDLMREMEKRRKRAEMIEEEEIVPMEIVRLKDRHKIRVQASSVFQDEVGEYVSLKDVKGQNDDISNNWEVMLQKRLTEEIKDKELQHVFLERGEDQNAAFVDEFDDDIDNNWEINDCDKESLLPKSGKINGSKNNFLGSSNLIKQSSSAQSIEFIKDYNYPMNIDRDAILFHQMQMARASRQSTDSLNSVQSVPANPVMKDFNGGLKTSSHSIEVLIHGQEQKACAHSIEGSEPDTETRHQQNESDVTEFCKGVERGPTSLQNIPQNSPLLQSKQSSKLPKKDATVDHKVKNYTQTWVEHSEKYSKNEGKLSPKEEKIKRTRQEVEKIKRGINPSHSSESHSPPQYRYGATRPDDQNRKSHLVNGNTDQIDPHSKNTTKRVNRSPQLKHNSPNYNRKINGHDSHKNDRNVHEIDHEHQFPDICDTSVVSGYKHVNSSSEKKHRAPQPPIAVPQILERSESDVTNIRATSGIPSILQNSNTSVQMSCGVFDDYPTTERKKCNNCRSSEDVDYTNISSSNIKDIVMGTKERTKKYINTIEITPKIQEHVSGEFEKCDKGPKYINTIEVIPISPRQKPKQIKQKMYKVETDYNANSISSLEGIYHLIGSSKSKQESPILSTPKPLTRSRSLESLINRSISQQSVMVTYL